MIRGVLNPELALNDLRHPLAGPEVGPVAERLSALQQKALQTSSLGTIELPVGTWVRLGPESPESAIHIGSSPRTDGLPRDVETPSDLGWNRPVLEHQGRNSSPFFERLSRGVGLHERSDAPEIALSRSQ